MGSGSSKPDDPNDYIDNFSEAQLATIKERSNVWRLYSEDLEFIPTKLKLDKNPEQNTELKVGRRPDSQVVVTNKTVSGTHAQLTYNPGTKTWSCQDLGSSTGTLVFHTNQMTKAEGDNSVELGPNVGMRLGKCFVVLVADTVHTKIMIECVKGNLSGKTWFVTSKTLSVGRDPSNTIHVTDHETISTSHFQVYKYNGWFAISDLGSRIGTYLNGKRLRKHDMNYLWMGCRITIGKDDGSYTDFIVKCRPTV